MCAFTKQVLGVVNLLCHVFYVITRIGVGSHWDSRHSNLFLRVLRDYV